MRPLPWANDGLSHLPTAQSVDEGSTSSQARTPKKKAPRSRQHEPADGSTGAAELESQSRPLVDVYEEMRPGYEADDQYRMVEEGSNPSLVLLVD